MKKLTKDEALRLVEEYVGKGKVNIQELSINDDKYGWKVIYKQGKKLEVIHFENYFEAQDFCFEFGGNNNMTIAAPNELLFIDHNDKNWSSSKIKEMGHKIISISFSKCYGEKDSDKTFNTDLPEDCGIIVSPGKKTKDGTYRIKLKRSYQQRDVLFGKTVYFENEDQFDMFLDFMAMEFPNHKIPISQFKTINLLESFVLQFKRKSVGDGSKTMELRLTHINGEHFSKFRFQDILNIADGLAGTTCERVIKTRKKDQIEDRCGISLGL